MAYFAIEPLNVAVETVFRLIQANVGSQSRIPVALPELQFSFTRTFPRGSISPVYWLYFISSAEMVSAAFVSITVLTT
jgi:hypothetical protein